MIHPTCPRDDDGKVRSFYKTGPADVARVEESTELSRRKAKDENFHDSANDCAI
jgi:hypothetical protein